MHLRVEVQGELLHRNKEGENPEIPQEDQVEDVQRKEV
jgi:hypothetical protein